MPWIPPAGHMTVTLVDLDTTAKLVVWGEGKRHDVVTTKAACLGGEHGAEVTTGKKNTVVFRCETQGKSDIVADEWMIRWQDKSEFPTIYRHWHGTRFHRDPKWAGGKLRYPEQAVDDNDQSECCCSWEDEGEESYEHTSKRYCKGSSDHHGVCVADAKCKKDDEDQ